MSIMAEAVIYAIILGIAIGYKLGKRMTHKYWADTTETYESIIYNGQEYVVLKCDEEN